MRIYVRQLSASRAAMCENAVLPKCLCRCQGLLHGIAHSRFISEMDKFFELFNEIDEESVVRLANGETYEDIMGGEDE